MKPAIKITLLHLLIVAVAGVWMRAMPVLPSLGITFDYLRHAHSHLAFLGWAYPAFSLAFVHWFLPAGSFETGRYRLLFWGSQASAAGMFVAFLAGGYGPLSIALLTVHTLLAWIFTAFFLKDLGLAFHKISFSKSVDIFQNSPPAPPRRGGELNAAEITDHGSSSQRLAGFRPILFQERESKSAEILPKISSWEKLTDLSPTHFQGGAGGDAGTKKTTINHRYSSLPARQPLSVLYVKAALAFFYLSSLGPFAIPIVQIAGGNPLWMKTAVGFYLHFQADGWFVFGLLALFFRSAEVAGVSISPGLSKGLWAALLACVVPGFLAHLPFFEFSPAAKWVMRIAATVQWAALFGLLVHVFQKNKLALLAGTLIEKSLLKMALAALWLKMACQLLALLPGSETLFDLRNHFLTLGYLHLLFLGSVTSMLFFFFSKENPAEWRGKLANVGGSLFLAGFAGTEVLLFLAGLGFEIPGLAVWLLLFSVLLLGGIGLLTVKLWGYETGVFFKSTDKSPKGYEAFRNL